MNTSPIPSRSNNSINNMNRYRGPTIGGPSKATTSTLCQKCLKRDIYECKAVAQERPYVSRPSRTQQLLNPKLVPKLTSDVPQDLLRKQGVADEQLAKAEQERGRKRERYSEHPESRGGTKRMRSASSTSVSTISTDRSQSPPARPATGKSDQSGHRRMSISDSPPRGLKVESPNLAQPPPRQSTESEKKRRRDSFSSVDSYTSDDGRGSRDRADRSTRRRFNKHSPPARGRRTESRSPHRGRRKLSNDRQHARSSYDGNVRRGQEENKPPVRERSLSPFSKRLALTQAMNMGR